MAEPLSLDTLKQQNYPQMVLVTDSTGTRRAAVPANKLTQNMKAVEGLVYMTSPDGRGALIPQSKSGEMLKTGYQVGPPTQQAPKPEPQSPPPPNPRASETRVGMLNRTVVQPFREFAAETQAPAGEQMTNAALRGATLGMYKNPFLRALGNLVTEGGEKVSDAVRNQWEGLGPGSIEDLPISDPEASPFAQGNGTVTVPGEDIRRVGQNFVAPAAEASATKILAPMAQPESIPVMGAFKAIPATNALGRAIHAGTGAYMGIPALRKAVEGGAESYMAAQEGNTPEAVQKGTEALFDTALAAETLGGAARMAPRVGRDAAAVTRRTVIPAVAGSRPVQLVKEGVQGVRAAWNPEKNLTAEQAATKSLRPSVNKSNWKQEVNSALPDIKRELEISGKNTESVNLEDVLKATGEAKKRLWREYADNYLDPAQNATVDGNAIADAMLGTITNRMRAQNPGLVKTIQRKAATYRNRQLSVAEAQEFLTEANGETRAIEARQLTDKKAAKNDPQNAYKFAERDTLRTSMDAVIDSVSGEGGAALRKRWGALNSVEGATAKRAIVDQRRNPVSLTRLFEIVHGPVKIIRGLSSGSIGDVAAGVFATKQLSNAEKMNDPNWLIRNALGKTQASPPQVAPRTVNPFLRGAVSTPMIEGLPTGPVRAPEYRPTPQFAQDAFTQMIGKANENAQMPNTADLDLVRQANADAVLPPRQASQPAPAQNTSSTRPVPPPAPVKAPVVESPTKAQSASPGANVRQTEAPAVRPSKRYTVQDITVRPLASDTKGQLVGDHDLQAIDSQGNPVGRISITDHGKRNVEVSWSEVPEELRGQGIGSAMYLKAIEFAKQRGARVILSDILRTKEAEQVWGSLERQGVPVQRDAMGRSLVDVSRWSPDTITRITDVSDPSKEFLASELSEGDNSSYGKRETTREVQGPVTEGQKGMPGSSQAVGEGRSGEQGKTGGVRELGKVTSAAKTGGSTPVSPSQPATKSPSQESASKSSPSKIPQRSRNANRRKN